MTDKHTPDLCPFCKSDAEHIERHNPMSKWKHSIDCKRCGASGPVEATKAEAIAAWNQRANPQPAAVDGLATPPPASADTSPDFHGTPQGCVSGWEVPAPAIGEVERIARSALRPDDMARTEIVKPVNGTLPYSYVTFAGARIEFQQSDFSKYHNGSVVYDAGTDKAAAQATRINDLLFDLAKRAATAALSTMSPAGDVERTLSDAFAVSETASVGQWSASVHFGPNCQAMRAFADAVRTHLETRHD